MKNTEIKDCKLNNKTFCECYLKQCYTIEDCAPKLIIKKIIGRPFEKKNRVGEKHMSNKGEPFTIIEYFGWDKCTIQFEDGTIVKDRTFGQITSNQIKKPNPLLNKEFITNEGYKGIVLENSIGDVCRIRLEDGTEMDNIHYSNIKKGAVKNPNHKSVCGVGYVGQGKYKSYSNVKAYSLWESMLQRCYSKLLHSRQSTYKDCYISSEWECFQNYSEWHEQNYKPDTMKGWHLDKDILQKGNKIYSSITCCFVPREINELFKTYKKSTGSCCIGVNRVNNRYTSAITKDGEFIWLGTFDTEELAFQAYKTEKEKYIKEIADKWKSFIKPEVYKAMYNWIVEMTD